ncbi:MAG: DNA methylase [Spirochaetota bacterium]|jgi:DNA modification methylase|nr:DNA methylase [Spirochaetota bacterium]
MKKHPTLRQTTTLWDYPAQNYPGAPQGDIGYTGATPSYIIWNLLQRYTKKKDLVVDPMCGSGTTIDVARELGRRALGYDLAPTRKDIFRADARRLPLETGKADFVFIDPPYSDHIQYAGGADCIGRLSAADDAYYEAMAKVISEIHRVLRPARYMALYVSDSYEKGKPFMPIGFRLYALLAEFFATVDIIAVRRHNAKLFRNNWHSAAVEHNYFLRGFHYLFIMYKEERRGELPRPRFDEQEVRAELEARRPLRDGQKQIQKGRGDGG